ncbi:MAG: hypothetical protein ACO1G5_09905, partial [Bacteroidota bacterium]
IRATPLLATGERKHSKLSKYFIIQKKSAFLHSPPTPEGVSARSFGVFILIFTCSSTLSIDCITLSRRKPSELSNYLIFKLSKYFIIQKKSAFLCSPPTPEGESAR